jgi:hypothetical protein
VGRTRPCLILSGAGKPARGRVPRVTLLPGDEQETARRDELPQGVAVAVLVVDPGVGSGEPGPVDGSQTRTSSTGDGAGVTVVHAP